MRSYIKPKIIVYTSSLIKSKIGLIQNQYSINLYYQHISSQDVSMISNVKATKLDNSYITFNEKLNNYV